MLSRILYSYYKPRAKITRQEFLISQIAFSAGMLFLLWFYRDLFKQEQIDVLYLIRQSILSLSSILLVLSLLMARLRDMDWNPYLALFVFPAQLIQIRNLVIYMELKGIESLDPSSFFIVEALFSLIMLVLMICMLFVKSAPNPQLPQVSPRSGG